MSVFVTNGIYKKHGDVPQWIHIAIMELKHGIID